MDEQAVQKEAAEVVAQLLGKTAFEQYAIILRLLKAAWAYKDRSREKEDEIVRLQITIKGLEAELKAMTDTAVLVQQELDEYRRQHP